MNEDGNNGVTNGPVFSSPNISSGNETPQANVNQEPTPQAITSADVMAMSNTDAGVVAAAAASMPENDAPATVISSAPNAGVSSVPKGRSRLGFNNRRFNASAQQQQQSAPVFAGAPDFFNQAAGEIVINSGDSDKGNKKRIIAIVSIIALVLVGGIVATMLLTKAPKTELSDLSNNEIGRKIEDNATNLRHMEIIYNNIAKQDIDVYDLVKEGFCSEIKSGKEAYDTLKPMISDYFRTINEGHEYYGDYKKAVDAFASETDFSGMYERCEDAVKYITGKSESINSEYGESFKDAAEEIKKAYNFEIPEKMSCPEEGDNSVECQNYWKMRAERGYLVAQTSERISKDIFNITSVINDDKRAGCILADLTEKLNTVKVNEKK